MEVSLTAEQEAQLSQLAAQEGKSEHELAREVLVCLAAEAHFIAAVKIGEHAACCGDFVEQSEVWAESSNPEPHVLWTTSAAADLKYITRHIRNTCGRSKCRQGALRWRNSLRDTLSQRGREGRITGTRELVFPAGLTIFLVYQITEHAV